MADPKTIDIFISHLAEEGAVASLLKETLQAAFGPELKVFASTDKVSIGSGKPWYDTITKALLATNVVIVLLSQESSRRPWINFEAGVGIGADVTVIPLTLGRFSNAQVPFPIAGIQIHSIDDIGVVVLTGRELVRIETRATRNYSATLPSLTQGRTMQEQ